MPVAPSGTIGEWDSTYLTRFLNDWLRRNPLPAQDQLTIKKLAVTDTLTPPFGTPKITSAPLSSGPPPSPFDGDVWFATNVDANGTVWQFRYNQSSPSLYKWEFVGGSAFYSAVDTFEGTASLWAAVVDLATVGPQYTVVREGDYEWMFAARVRNSVANGGSIAVIAANGVTDAAPATVVETTAANDDMVSELGVSTAVPAAATIKLKYAALNAGTASFFQRRLFVRPKRIK